MSTPVNIPIGDLLDRLGAPGEWRIKSVRTWSQYGMVSAMRPLGDPTFHERATLHRGSYKGGDLEAHERQSTVAELTLEGDIIKTVHILPGVSYATGRQVEKAIESHDQMVSGAVV